jgi:hypothetical protein
MFLQMGSTQLPFSWYKSLDYTSEPEELQPPPKKSPLQVLPPELRQEILHYAIEENNIAFAVFSSTCRSRRPLLWPTRDIDTLELKTARAKVLKRSLYETRYIRNTTISDWTIIEELFGEDLDELLETSWKRLTRGAIEQGMLEVLDGSIHNVGCGLACQLVEKRSVLEKCKSWYFRNTRSAGSILSS